MYEVMQFCWHIPVRKIEATFQQMSMKLSTSIDLMNIDDGSNQLCTVEKIHASENFAVGGVYHTKNKTLGSPRIKILNQQSYHHQI